MVLCHVPNMSVGSKSPDLLGAWGCHSCHDYVDGRSYPALKEDRRLALLEGVIRTQRILIEEGKLTW